MIDNSMPCVTLTHSYLFGSVQLAQCQTCTTCDIQTCYHGVCNINARSADWSFCIRVAVWGLYKDRHSCFVQDGTIATCNCHVLHLRLRHGLLPKCVGLFSVIFWGSCAPCLLSRVETLCVFHVFHRHIAVVRAKDHNAFSRASCRLCFFSVPPSFQLCRNNDSVFRLYSISEISDQIMVLRTIYYLKSVLSRAIFAILCKLKGSVGSLKSLQKRCVFGGFVYMPQQGQKMTHSNPILGSKDGVFGVDIRQRDPYGTLYCKHVMTWYFIGKRKMISFDATLGYPGEGPQTWTCTIANIDSIITHPHCLEWKDDALILQETRVAKSNVQKVNTLAAETGRLFHTSQLLQPIRQKNGIFKIPHGGTAIIASSALITPFVHGDDKTKRWEQIEATTRVTAAWIQVMPKMRILVFSFYGYAYSNTEESVEHTNNDNLLAAIFEIASQYGDIPVLIGGDFQNEPSAYRSFQIAKDNAGWCDPLYTHDEWGNTERPITYSHSSNFVDPIDGVPTTDGLILNNVALLPLQV